MFVVCCWLLCVCFLFVGCWLLVVCCVFFAVCSLLLVVCLLAVVLVGFCLKVVTSSKTRQLKLKWYFQDTRILDQRYRAFGNSTSSLWPGIVISSIGRYLGCVVVVVVVIFVLRAIFVFCCLTALLSTNDFYFFHH